MSDASTTVFNGRYALQRQLARGGMADVFLARDELLDRPVAVKVLFPEFASDPAFVERFRREAQAAANLNHPNIVGVYDWGQEGGTYFIVMEYIEGRSLADIIRAEGPMEPDRAAEITSDVAAALSFAHRNGLVHRDVKPGNVLVTPSGQIKVADFGIATAANAGDANLTKTGLVMGTATYFSPEQAQGKPVDPRSDLYSLGVVLYEMLAGEPPFRGDSPVAIAYQHVQEPPPGLRSRGVPVNGPLEAITFKLLAKNPAHRYPAADDLRADLRRYRDGMHKLAAATPAAVALAGSNLPVATRQASAPATTAMAATTAVAHPDAAYFEPPRRGGSGARTGVFAVLIVLVLIVLAAIFLLLLTDGGDDGGDNQTPAVVNVPVPLVIGKPQAEAQDLLRDAKLTSTVELKENVNVAAGNVFAQTPGAGNKVAEGTQITLTVSSGNVSNKMPLVTGLQVTDAEALLRGGAYQLDVELVPDPKSTRPEGEVLTQTPGSGADVAAGSKVRISYSAPELVAIPDVAGKTAAQGATELVAAGFEPVAVEEASDTVEQGKVIRTDPVAGTKAKAKTKINMFVSSGLPKVVVPDVVGLGTAAAKQSIESAGLKFDPQFVDVPAGDARATKVISQTVAPNSQVTKGTSVVVTIGRAPVASTTTVGSPTTTAGGATTTTSRP